MIVEQRHIGTSPGNPQIDRIKSRHHNDTWQQIPDSELYVDDPGQSPCCRSRRRWKDQREDRIEPIHQQYRGDGGTQWKGTVHRQIRKVQYFISNVYAQSHHRIDESLLEDAND